MTRLINSMLGGAGGFKGGPAELAHVKRNLEIISLKLPETYVKALDELVETGLYRNRSEAIRVAIRDLLRRERQAVTRSARTTARVERTDKDFEAS